MKINKTFGEMTGVELIKLVNSNAKPVLLNGENTIILPYTIPFSNQAQISTVEEATHVTCQTRWMDRPELVVI